MHSPQQRLLRIINSAAELAIVLHAIEGGKQRHRPDELIKNFTDAIRADLKEIERVFQLEEG